MAVGSYPSADIVAQPTAVTARVRRNTTQSITNTTGTQITFNVVEHDTDGMWNASAPDRLTVRTPGKYFVTAGARWAVSAGGSERAVSIIHVRSGVTTLISSTNLHPGASGGRSGIGAAVFDCLAGDYFAAQVYQDSGSALNLDPTFAPMYLDVTLVSGNANGVPSGAKVYRETSATVTNASWNSMPWVAAETDTDAMWSASDPTKLFARKSGWYVITASLSMVNSSAGNYRILALWKNNEVLPLAEQSAPFSAAAESRLSVTAVTFLRAGDYMEVKVYQDSGASLNTSNGAAYPQEFSMVCITGTTVTTNAPPSIKISRSTNVSIAAAPWQKVPLSSGTVLHWDNNSMWNGTDVVIRTPGRYRVTGYMGVAPAGTANSATIAALRVNDGAEIALEGPIPMNSSHGNNFNLSGEVDLKSGDTLSLWLYQESGGARNVVGVAGLSPAITATLIQPISQAALMAPEAWHYVGAAGEPGFQNSWVNYAAYGPNARFYKDPLGVVHIDGLVKNGTVSTNGSSGTIFTLPVGYRPGPMAAGGTGLILATVSNDGFGQLRIYDNGTVQAWSGSNIWMSLDAISFRAV